MMTPTIQVLGLSHSEETLGGNDDIKTASLSTSSRLRLHGRITVFNQDGSFDSVRVRLQGAIRTKIGSQVATEKVRRADFFCGIR